MSIAATPEEHWDQIASSPDSVDERTHGDSSQQSLKVAYIMSRFPKLTETFVLFEMLALQRQGANVEVFPLLRARNSKTHPEGAGVWNKFLELFRRPESTAVMHAEAASFVEQAHFAPMFGWAIMMAQFYFLLRKPGTYLGTLWTVIRANYGSANYLLGGLALFPKTVFFAREMSRLNVSHIHAHFANHPAAAAFVIHQLTGIPFSFTAHGSDLQVDQHMLREKVAAAKYVITISRYNEHFIKELCGESANERVRVIRCGVDTRVFEFPCRGKEATPTSDRAMLEIICVGTLYEVKGHRYLIEACGLLKQQGMPFRCRMVGDGPLLEQLRKQAVEAGLSESIEFLGRRTRQEIADFLQRADVLVAPSVPTADGRREGIPVVLMEAMASGLPVVSSDISGIPELVEHEHTGLLTPPRDARGLAEALLTLFHNAEERDRLGHAARQRILKEYDLDKNASRLLACFAEEDK